MKSRDGGLRVVFTVALATQDDANGQPVADDDALPAEVEVALAFLTETQKRISMEHLDRLGFSDIDLSRLHPDHPDAVILVNVPVRVRPKFIDGRTYWNFSWQPMRMALDDAQRQAAAIAEDLAALRNGTPPTGNPGTSFQGGGA